MDKLEKDRMWPMTQLVNLDVTSFLDVQAGPTTKITNGVATREQIRSNRGVMLDLFPVHWIHQIQFAFKLN